MNKKNIITLLATVTLYTVISVPLIAKATTIDNIPKSTTGISISDLESSTSSFIVEDSTEENYIKSLAEREGISIAEAKLKHNNLLKKQNALKRPTEQVVYRTITQTQSIRGSKINTIIGVEASILRDNITGKYSRFVGVGNPYIRISGPVSTARWDGGSPNISYSSSNIRISYTGSAYVGVNYSDGASLGAYGFTLSSSTAFTKYYYSPVVTQVLSKNINYI